MDLYTIRKELMLGKSIYDLPLRVTYYTRVSTLKDEQKSSLENQDIYYKDIILKNPNWTLVEGYMDNGITGTSTKKRKDFINMIEDGFDDCYDLILTKEVCRFARNTLDTLQITRKLLDKGIGIIFELDNINTLEQEGELRLTIMASLAQDESRRVSERTKFGFARSIEKGRVLGNNSIWGYQKNNCKLVINEREAKIIKRIFEVYSTGDIGIRRLGQVLAQEGILSRKNKPFSYSTLNSILRNPKYKGFYVGKKSETIDFLTRKRVMFSKEDWIEYKAEEDIVPAIISEELWNRCSEILEKRGKHYAGAGKGANNKYEYSSILVCSKDGKTYWRTKNRPTAKDDVWICSEYAKGGTKLCSNNTRLKTNELNQIMSDMFKELHSYKNRIIDKVQKINKTNLQLYKNNIYDNNKYEEELLNLENEKKNLIKLYSLNKIDENEFEYFNNEYKSKILECKKKIKEKSVDKKIREIEKNNKKIKEFFDYEEIELTKEFIHNKINRIYVTQIEKNHVRLKINFHFDLLMSEVDKKSICLELTM